MGFVLKELYSNFEFQDLYFKFYIPSCIFDLGPEVATKEPVQEHIFYVPCFLVLVLDSGLGTVAGVPKAIG